MGFDFSFACPQCGATLYGKDEWIGKPARCNHCQHRLVVPPRPSATQQPPLRTSGAVVSPPPPAMPPVAPALPADQPHLASPPPPPPSIQPHTQATDDHWVRGSDPERTLLNTIHATVASNKSSSSLGIGSIVLAIVGLFTLCLPFVALPLLLLGLALGVAGLAVALKRKGSGIGLPIAGSAICTVLLIPPTIMLFAAGALVGAVKEAAKGHEGASASAAEDASSAARGSISTTDLEATVRYTSGLFKEWRDELNRAGQQTQGNAIASQKEISRVNEQNVKRITDELSKLEGQSVQWRFTISRILEDFINFREAPNTGYAWPNDESTPMLIWFSDNSGEEFAHAPGYLKIQGSISRSDAERLRPGDSLLIRAEVRVRVNPIGYGSPNSSLRIAIQLNNIEAVTTNE